MEDTKAQPNPEENLLQPLHVSAVRMDGLQYSNRAFTPCGAFLLAVDEENLLSRLLHCLVFAAKAFDFSLIIVRRLSSCQNP